MNGLDWFMVLWAAWACVSYSFHSDSATGLVFRLGLVYNACGIYFLLRVFCRSVDDVVTLCRATAVLLVPVAAEMIYEHLAFRNLFAILGSAGETPSVREGRIRAAGPFSHAILAGTVGAVNLPLMIGLWPSHRKAACTGMVACVVMIVASASSGPLLSAIVGVVGLAMWSLRHRMRVVRWLAVTGYVVLDLAMSAPAYYLIGRLDLAGGSTGYHRARLMESAMEHIGEWWLSGTDYTRHWMATGVSWNQNHTDITNHYLYMGVLGGLPLMLLFLGMLATGFAFVGESVAKPDMPPHHRFVVWALGTALFTHAATCISISYFDQSVVFLYLVVAGIGSVAGGYGRRRMACSRRGVASASGVSAGGTALRGRACSGYVRAGA
jgi:hypothetical protein